MPAIVATRRVQIIDGDPPRNPSELAYAIAKVVVDYLDDFGHVDRWDDLSNVHKALIAVEREFYRVRIAPHEDAKYKINGPVF